MKPVLAVMAAGMGSRYGGLKQMDPVDEYGNVILHYSVYDAIRAGFEEVVFIIKPETEEDFRKIITDRLEGKINYSFAYQKLDDLPEGFSVPEGRVKPWGTGHAVMSLSQVLKGQSFIVINADDYYGSTAFKRIMDFAQENAGAEDRMRYGLVAYLIENTVTKYGHVARGICSVDEDRFLTEVTERTHIEEMYDGPAFTEDGGRTWTRIPEGTPVSMNFWCFPPSFLDELKNRFPAFLAKALDENPQKAEYFLPGVVEQLLSEDKARVKVMTTPDKWHGVTYREDKPVLVKELAVLREKGLYLFDSKK